MTQLQLHQATSQVTFHSLSAESFLILENPILCSNKFFPLLEKSENLAGLGSLYAHPYTRGGDFGSPVLKEVVRPSER